MTIVSEQYLDIVTYNKNALNNLRRAVVLGQDQFSLILARVNYQRLQRVLAVELGVHLHLDKVVVPADASNLRDVLEAQTSRINRPANQPRALMVTGLETISAIAPAEGDNGKTFSPLEKILRAANLGRDGLPKRFPYPVIFWVNDTVLQQLNRYAPDLKSFAATPLRFEYPTQSLIAVLREQAADTFTQILDVDKSVVLSDCLPLRASITEPLAARELTFALTQLEHLPDDQSELVNNGLLADLLFLQGRNLHQQGDLIRARSYYEDSLVHWQQDDSDQPIRQMNAAGEPQSNGVLKSVDKQAVLNFHLGLWWRRHAALSKGNQETKAAYHQARQYFENSLAIFRREDRSDRIGRFVLALADVVHKLEDWTALSAIAHESTHLHQHDPARLARDYGYLAEVALAQYQQTPLPAYLRDAQNFAQRALETSDQALQLPGVRQKLEQNPNTPGPTTDSKAALRYHRGCYFDLLASAYQLQGQTKPAINQSERALQNIDPRYDLSLYRQVLERLWHLYYDHQYYAEAFEIKLEQRRIENLFGLRAFIGASQIQPSSSHFPYATLPGVRSTHSTVLSAEIKASGRTEDIESLVDRLSQPRYTLVVMHGQSGVGKSSILHAGLMPRLRSLTSEGRTTLPVMVNSYSQWEKILHQELRLFTGDVVSAAEVVATSPLAYTPDGLIDLLTQITTETYQQIILVFDQFEDFFYQHPTFSYRQGLYRFLRDCLNLPYVKVVLSLREDFLHYLLEWDRHADLSIIDNDILSKEIRYYLGNFSPQAAERLIEYLTASAEFELEPGLITALVDELAEETGEVRPIELQVVGAQLQRENITTLADYRQLGNSPKSQLLKNFLNSVIQDCGPENTSIARSVLYLLSEGETRPLKSLSELQEPLALAHIESAPQQLSLVLDILIGSGLVFEVPEVSGARYQLVHEYLASLVQEQQQPGLIEVLQAERNRRQLTEDQLRKALVAQSDSLAQATIAKKKAKLAEIKALVSVARSLQLSGDGIEAMAKALQAANQVEGTDDNLLKMQVALCLAESVRSIHERNELSGHRNWVLAVHCNPVLAGEATAQRIASASEDGTIKLWNGRGERVWSSSEGKMTSKGETPTSANHTAGIIDVRFSPDGQYFASASLDHTIRLWRADGEFIRSIEAAAASVTSINFSPTAPLLAATYSDTVVRLWSLEGELVQQLEGHEDWVRTVAFSPDGTRLATGGEDNTVRLWSIDGELLDTLHGHRGWVRSVAFSPDGRMIVSAGDANTLRLWSVDGYKLDIFYGHEDWVRSVAFSPDGRYIASASDDQTVRVWELEGTVLHTFSHRSSVHSVAWSADGRSLISGGDDDQVRIWWLEGPKVPVAKGHQGIVWSARWQPVVDDGDTSKILSSGGDAALKIWSESGERLQTIEGHQKGVHSGDWRPDGKFFASASADYTVKIWRADGQLVRTLAGHGDAVWQVRYSPDGKQLASVSSDRTVRLWSHQGQLLHTWTDHTDTVWHVGFSPDSQHLISASEDNTLRLWHTQKGLLQTLEGHTGGTWCAAFGPQGRWVASGGADGVVRLWSVRESAHESDKETSQLWLAPHPILLDGHRDWVRSVCFCPKGDFLASASDDGTVRLWSLDADILRELDTQKARDISQLLPSLTGHEGVVWDVDFDATGERLVSAGADSTVRIWDLRLAALRTQGCAWLADWLLAHSDLRPQLCESSRL